MLKSHDPHVQTTNYFQELFGIKSKSPLFVKIRHYSEHRLTIAAILYEEDDTLHIGIARAHSILDKWSRTEGSKRAIKRALQNVFSIGSSDIGKDDSDWMFTMFGSELKKTVLFMPSSWSTNCTITEKIPRSMRINWYEVVTHLNTQPGLSSSVRRALKEIIKKYNREYKNKPIRALSLKRNGVGVELPGIQEEQFVQIDSVRRTRNNFKLGSNSPPPSLWSKVYIHGHPYLDDGEYTVTTVFATEEGQWKANVLDKQDKALEYCVTPNQIITPKNRS